MHNHLFSPKMFRAIVGDKQVYDMGLMIMAYCDLLLHNNLSLLEILGWLIDVNLAIVYLMTNFFFKENSPNYCNFYV